MPPRDKAAAKLMGPAKPIGPAKPTGPAPLTAPLAAAKAGQAARAVERWFAENRRELSWRTNYADAAHPPGTAARDPWLCLMAEAMLQQTQVSRVIEYLARFGAAFPTPAAMASAPESTVLAMWAGLGYYRRARNLRNAAVEIVARFGGEVPTTAAELATLPGVGRYTAGAIASIVFGHREPLVDGNVARVLLRLTGDQADPTERRTIDRLWTQATALVARAAAPGLLNEGLMELGALICTPAPSTPRCDQCPLASLCVARAQGLTGAIPAGKPGRAKAKPIIYADAVVCRDARGRLLLHKRASTGLWADMWQVPTVESISSGATLQRLAAELDATGLTIAGRFVHQTTHREIRFVVWRAKSVAKPAGAVWLAAADLASVAISNAAKRAISIGLDTVHGKPSAVQQVKPAKFAKDAKSAKPAKPAKPAKSVAKRSRKSAPRPAR